MSALTPQQLADMGVLNQDEVVENSFARVLVMGPAKAGKTTSLLATAPAPLHINCDGMSAAKGASALGGKFLSVDAFDTAGLKRALEIAEKLVAAGNVKTVVLDTVTLLADNLLDQLSVTRSGFELWGDLAELLVATVKRLCKLQAHIFVVAHMMPDNKNDAAGIMPAIGGSSKVRIPALLDDWILLDVEPGRKPERVWLLGPQKSWSHSGRNIRRTTQVEATVPALLAELGIPL